MLFAEVFWSFYDYRDDVWAAISIGAERYTMTGKFKRGARLGASRDLHGDFAVYGLHVYFSAKSGIYHADMFFGKNNSALASEVFVRLDANADIKIAFFATFGSVATFAA